MSERLPCSFDQDLWGKGTGQTAGVVETRSPASAATIALERGTGARGLRTAIEEVLEGVLFRSRANDVVPFADPEELIRNSGLPTSALIEVVRIIGWLTRSRSWRR